MAEEETEQTMSFITLLKKNYKCYSYSLEYLVLNE